MVLKYKDKTELSAARYFPSGKPNARTPAPTKLPFPIAFSCYHVPFIANEKLSSSLGRRRCAEPHLLVLRLCRQQQYSFCLRRGCPHATLPRCFRHTNCVRVCRRYLGCPQDRR